jgi:cholesterol transport system auxiliary component
MRRAQRAAAATVGALVVALVTAACSLGPAPRAPLARYDLGPVLAGPAFDGPRLPYVFIVHEASGPLWLDSGDMIYRLSYDEPGRLRRYANSQWVVSPLTLTAERLRARLAARSERGGGLPDLGIPADYWVRVAVEDFGQVFDAPRTSRGVVRLRVVLVRARGHLFIAQQDFAGSVAAATPDARGGVVALSAALEECVAAAVDWIGERVAGGAPGAGGSR